MGLFVDDLSFEEDEISYKEFKGLLEGGLESRPQNVVVYATTNRRHLVREFFKDQQELSALEDEIRMGDTVQEKLSLADRFGITLFFPTPTQEEFLTMVEKIAKEMEINMPLPLLRQKALAWEKWQNSRSGRTARQFIDYLVGHHGEELDVN